MLVLLESLSPEQRAVLLLHDVFDYAYAEIADGSSARTRTTCDSSPPGRGATSSSGGRASRHREQRDELAGRFFAAAEHGDLAGFEALLAARRRLTGDGGGKVPRWPGRCGAAPGRADADDWLGCSEVPGVSMRPVEVNGAPGALFLDGQERLIAVWALDIADGRSRHQLGRQPRQARPPRPGRRRHRHPPLGSLSLSRVCRVATTRGPPRHS